MYYKYILSLKISFFVGLAFFHGVTGRCRFVFPEGWDASNLSAKNQYTYKEQDRIKIFFYFTMDTNKV